MALPVDEALQRKISELAEGREPVSRRLGVALAPPQAARHLRAAAGLPEVDGLLIRVVEEGGAAERAGMRRGDVMVSAAGHHLGSVDDLHTALEEDAATLEIGLVRATEELTVTVRFGE
jgi:serine protease Do